MIERDDSAYTGPVPYQPGDLVQWLVYNEGTVSTEIGSVVECWRYGGVWRVRAKLPSGAMKDNHWRSVKLIDPISALGSLGT